jgi:hypothetical protein
MSRTHLERAGSHSREGGSPVPNYTALPGLHRNMNLREGGELWIGKRQERRRPKTIESNKDFWPLNGG